MQLGGKAPVRSILETAPGFEVVARSFYAAILLAPDAERRIAEAVFATRIGWRHPRLVLLQDANDLILREP